MKKVKKYENQAPDKLKGVKFNSEVGKRFGRKNSKKYEAEPYEDEEEDQDEDTSYLYDEEEYELHRKTILKGIREELEDCLSLRPDFTVIELNENWALVARSVVLKVNVTSNPNGFQPFEKTVEAKKCILCIIQYGEGPKRGENSKNGCKDIPHMAYILKKKGCQVIQLNSKYDVDGKLNEI